MRREVGLGDELGECRNDISEGADVARTRVLVLVVVSCLLCGVMLTGCKAKQEEPVSESEPVVAVEPEPEPEPERTVTFYAQARDFTEGVAWVNPNNADQNALTGWQLIDGDGEVIFKLTTGKPGTNFENGVAVVFVRGGDDSHLACTVIDKAGKTVFPKSGDANVYKLESFEDGYTFVETEVNTAEHYETQRGLVNSSGEWVVEPSSEFDVVTSGLRDLGIMNVRYGEYRYFDTVKGEFFKSGGDKAMAERAWERVFDDGMVFVHIWGDSVGGGKLELDEVGFVRTVPHVTNGNFDGGCAFYDTNKNMVINLFDYSHAEPAGCFSGGYCSMYLDNGHSKFVTIIDKTGKQMFTPIEHGEIYSYSQERAMFKGPDDTYYSYIDVTGTTVIEENIMEGFPFTENGVARIRFASRPDVWCFIDTGGVVAF